MLSSRLRHDDGLDSTEMPQLRNLLMINPVIELEFCCDRDDGDLAYLCIKTCAPSGAQHGRDLVSVAASFSLDT